MPIMEHPLSETVESGVRYGALLEGLVPEMEEREAAVFSRLSWPSYRALSWLERAQTIAHYRLHHVVDLHRNDAASREMSRRTARARSR